MKKIDLNNINDLLIVKDKLDEVFNKHISDVKLEETIKKVDTLTFPECKHLFEGLTDRLFNVSNGKKVIRKYVNILKENEDLKTYYCLCNNLTTKLPIDDTKLYVTECASFAKKLNKKTNNKFHNIIKEAIKVSGLNSEEIENILKENKELNESINFILSNKKTPSNLNEYTKHVSLISESLEKNTKKENINDYVDEVDETEDLTSLIENESLLQWEKDVIEEIALCNLRGGNKSDIFEKYKANCLSLIDENIENTENLETIKHLTTMRNQLSEKIYNEENSNQDILRLSELKKTLSEA